MSGWTEEAREKQRQLIFQRKPWLKSTGATTLAGKATSSQNARKDKSPEEIALNEDFIRIRKQLKSNAALIKEVLKNHYAAVKKRRESDKPE